MKGSIIPIIINQQGFSSHCSIKPSFQSHSPPWHSTLVIRTVSNCFTSSTLSSGTCTRWVEPKWMGKPWNDQQSCHGIIISCSWDLLKMVFEWFLIMIFIMGLNEILMGFHGSYWDFQWDPCPFLCHETSTGSAPWALLLTSALGGGTWGVHLEW